MEKLWKSEELSVVFELFFEVFSEAVPAEGGCLFFSCGACLSESGGFFVASLAFTGEGGHTSILLLL